MGWSPQNRPDPTKTVTVRVTKSVFVTAKGIAVVTGIGRNGSGVTGRHQRVKRRNKLFQNQELN